MICHSPTDTLLDDRRPPVASPLCIRDDIFRVGAPWLDFGYLPKEQRFALVKLLHPLSPDLVEQGASMLRIVDLLEVWDTYLATTASEALWASGQAVNAASVARTIETQFRSISLTELRPSLVDRVLRIRAHDSTHFFKLTARSMHILGADMAEPHLHF